MIKRFLKRGRALINVGAQLSTSARAIAIAERYKKGVYAAVGLHPIHLAEDIKEEIILGGKKYSFATRKEELDINQYRQLAKSSNKVVAVGEIGLDYFYLDKFSAVEAKKIKAQQAETLISFIGLAEELSLPIIFHCRGNKSDNYTAYDDLLKIIQGEINAGRKIKGVIHCFGGNESQARAFLDLGFYLGITGIITFKKKSEELQNIVKNLPLEKILIETDAPFLAPEPHRGERNEPLFVEFVAKKIAELKNLTLAEVVDATGANAKKLFNI